METLIQKTVLSNGLTIITERIPGIRSVSFGVWIKSGSNADDVDTSGIAHFIEHMLFKGTETRKPYDIARSLESVGGTLNAFTSRDVTCLYAVVLDKYLDLAVDIVSDILLHSILPDDEIEREKNVIAEEIHASHDVPEEYTQDTFTDTVLFPEPESKSVLGTIETVTSLTRNDLIEFIDSNYYAANIVVAVAGNVHHEELVSQLETCSFKERIHENRWSRNCDIDKSIMMSQDRNLSQSHICTGSKIFGFSDPRHVSLWILNTILGDGMSSRLFQNVREKHGLTYSIYSFTELFKSVGVMATYAATDAIHSEKVQQLIFDEYRRLRDEYVDQQVLRDAKNQIIGNLMLGLESSYNRMNRLARQEIYLGEYREIDDTIQEITSVEESDIRKTAIEILNEENLRITVINS